MKLSQKERELKIKGALDFRPHPNLIIGTMVDKSVTAGGIIKPETADPQTPEMVVRAIGSSVAEQFYSALNIGDHCYIISQYANIADINGVEFVVCPADAILGIKSPDTGSINIETE